MDSSKIDRINELYHKSQSVGLTEEEKTEQAALKKEYPGCHPCEFKKQFK